MQPGLCSSACHNIHIDYYNRIYHYDKHNPLCSASTCGHASADYNNSSVNNHNPVAYDNNFNINYTSSHNFYVHHNHYGPIHNNIHIYNYHHNHQGPIHNNIHLYNYYNSAANNYNINYSAASATASN